MNFLCFLLVSLTYGARFYVDDGALSQTPFHTTNQGAVQKWEEQNQRRVLMSEQKAESLSRDYIICIVIFGICALLCRMFRDMALQSGAGDAREAALMCCLGSYFFLLIVMGCFVGFVSMPESATTVDPYRLYEFPITNQSCPNPDPHLLLPVGCPDPRNVTVHEEFVHAACGTEAMFFYHDNLKAWNDVQRAILYTFGLQLTVFCIMYFLTKAFFETFRTEKYGYFCCGIKDDSNEEGYFGMGCRYSQNCGICCYFWICLINSAILLIAFWSVVHEYFTSLPNMKNNKTDCEVIFTMFFLRARHAAEAFSLSTLAVFDLALLGTYCALTCPLMCAGLVAGCCSVLWYYLCCRCCRYCTCSYCCVNCFAVIMMFFFVELVGYYLFIGLLPMMLLLGALVMFIIFIAWTISSGFRLCCTHNCECTCYYDWECQTVEVEHFQDYLARFLPEELGEELRTDSSEGGATRQSDVEMAKRGPTTNAAGTGSPDAPEPSETQQFFDNVYEFLTGNKTTIILCAVPILFLVSAYLLNYFGDYFFAATLASSVDLWNYPIGAVDAKWVSGHDRVAEPVGLMKGTTEFFHYIYVNMWADIPKVFEIFKAENLRNFWHVEVVGAFKSFKDGALAMRTIMAAVLGFIAAK